MGPPDALRRHWHAMKCHLPRDLGYQPNATMKKSNFLLKPL
jgi:hypothetical protein